jgi:hypothetical protein
MTFDDWHVYTRDSSWLRQGEVDDFTDLQIIPAFCDVGTWTLTCSALSRQASNLLEPGWGIIVIRDDVTLFSGPADNRTYTVDAATNQIVVSGVSDDIWLKRRLVSPSPTESVPPYVGQAYDVRTGVASTIIQQYVNVNAGPGAITPRQIHGLTMAADPVVGTSVTGNGRWDELLAFIQTLALASGIGFRVIQVGAGLQFQTFAPTNRSSSVKFSIALGNLIKFEYTATAPTGNYVYVGGDGDGTARAIQELADSVSIATWGRIEAPFVSSTGTTNSTVMSQAATSALSQTADQASLNLTPTETATCRYGVHYFLGDTVTIQLAQPIPTPYGVAGQIVDQIQKVDIHLTPGGPTTVTPLVASAPKQTILNLFREFRYIKRRLNNLERH